MAKPIPVVTVRPRYEPFIAASTRAPTAATQTPAPRGTGSRRRTPCTAAGLPGEPGAGPGIVPRSAAAGSVMPLTPFRASRSSQRSSRRLRTQPEHLGPEDDDAEEDRVEQHVVVVAADVAAEHGLGDADRQPDRHRASRPAERREPRGDGPDQADRRPAGVGVAGQRGLDDAEQRGEQRRRDEDPPPELGAVDPDDPGPEPALAAGAGRPPGDGEAQVGPQGEPAHDG